MFVVNEETKTVLNYVAIVECPKFSLINLLETANGNQLKNPDHEDGYHSQEIFTQEKYFYLFYQGLRMLEYFYMQGISHGNINATKLRIKDDYSLCISDFSLATFAPGFSSLDEHQQQSKQ